jgi:hypothetical protein
VAASGSASSRALDMPATLPTPSARNQMSFLADLCREIDSRSN